MKRLLAFLFGRTRRVRATVIDLPEQFGPRMSLSEVRSLLGDAKNRPLVNALVQVLWMNRVAAEGRARDRASLGKPGSDFHLGEMEMVNNVMADLQRLVEFGAEPTGEMRQWFKPEEQAGEAEETES